jgi:hypothetical protein
MAYDDEMLRQIERDQKNGLPFRSRSPVREWTTGVLAQKTIRMGWDWRYWTASPGDVFPAMTFCGSAVYERRGLRCRCTAF